MAQRLQLRVFRTVLDAIETLLREAWPLFKIYAPPWLAGTAAVLVLDLMWYERSYGSYPPAILSALVFAPFSALIAVGATRWLWRKREDFRLFRFDEVWGWVAALFAVLVVVDTGLGYLREWWSLYILQSTGLITADWSTTSNAHLIWFWLALVPGWLLSAAIYFAAFPQVAVIVERGAPSLARQWRLLRIALLSLIALALIVGVCRLGLAYLFGYVATSLGIELQGLDRSLYGWREEVTATVWRSLWLLPANFLTDMLVLVVLARMYRALAEYVDRKTTAPE